jgi:hypothetical protein
MSDTSRREVAETLFERTQRREVEINNALSQEHVRREAAVKGASRPVSRPPGHDRHNLPLVETTRLI